MTRTALDDPVAGRGVGDGDRAGSPTAVAARRRGVDAETVLTVLMVGAVAVGSWPTFLAVGAPGPVMWAPLIAHATGMLAGYGVLVLIGLMSRTPALEHGVGADVLTRWHAKGARIVMGLIGVHACAAVVSWAQSRRENILIALIHVVGLPWLMAATVGTALLVAVAGFSVRSARRHLSYETWHGLHLLTYIGVALSFVHQLAGPDLTGHRVVQVAWALLYVHVFALVLRHRVLTPIQQAARHQLRVVDVVEEGPGVVSIEIAGHHLDELEAQSGQFFRWRFLTPDQWRSAHPFSLSAPATDTRLRLTVKALGGGSRNLQQIAVGTWVVAEGPYGALTAARRTCDDVLLIAGGVGITPMRALFETLPLHAGQQLTLLYRARGPEHVLMRDELDAIARRRGARIHYLVGDDHDCLGTPALLAYAPRLAAHDVYLCGPPAMADATRRSLFDAGLPAAQLHEERFSW